MVRYAILAIIMAAMAAPAAAYDAGLFALQMRLKKEGYYPGMPDGESGPMTRRAISEFAAKHSIDPNQKAVINEVIKQAVDQRHELTEAQIAATVEAVKDRLKDPYSADIQPRYGFMTSHGRFAVCGEVNAKNGYGAFTGFEWFIVPLNPTLSGTYTTMSPVLDQEATQAMCLMGTSFLDAIE